ncbi:PAK4-inhibitor INKA2 isoform X2 [Denticeps clupeoides]|nr:PAK4-inhibitor INKA2-like isoform X2 [Denticeps clupeoides]XP_028849947.1 PAK4-inhibitor INKA2-like isoform X2 [Denticeps clupeoides]
MREAGDGLHAQMNSMMGALQELKLLQVQTALEHLEISAKPALVSQTLSTQPSGPVASQLVEEAMLHSDSSMENQSPVMPRKPLLGKEPKARGVPRRGSLSTSPSISSSEDDSLSLSRRSSEESTSSYESSCSSSASGLSLQEPRSTFDPAQMAELQAILRNLSREGPSIDSDFSQDDGADDASDWTSSLMSHSRNRQPLVLGDNFFADLVGNWLDLPELERPEQMDGRPGDGTHPLRLSRSQEFCKKLSLTANIFKKVLRSVRPDRDKLLKERPGWMAAEDEERLQKRSKKTTAKPKGSFYRPFWSRGSKHKGKQNSESFPTSGINMYDRAWPHGGKHHPMFDYDSAIWV